MISLKSFICESINAKFIEELYEKFCKKYKLSDEDFEELFFIIHSDDHIASEVKKLITKMIKNVGEKPMITLYRGCSLKEWNAIEKTGKSPVPTLSFSENKEVASQFGDKLLEITTDLPMFCYHSMITEYYESMEKVDVEAYEMEDGETKIELAKKELEWICTNDYKFERNGEKYILVK